MVSFQLCEILRTCGGRFCFATSIFNLGFLAFGFG